MYKETITYTDYDGNERTEDFWFNLTKAEVAEMELSTDNGFERMIQRIVDTHDNRKLVEIFKDMIRRSYGVKSEDGRRFIKSPELTEAFMQTEAYSELFIKLLDADECTKFYRGVLPPTEEGKVTVLPAK